MATSPMMGTYLSHLGNKKASAVTGAVPDENFAREVMQLFTIGLVQLNIDGTPALVNGQPVETYGNADITGIARVFTGWSWAATGTTEAEFRGTSITDSQRTIKPMKVYPQHHETGSKVFLGLTIPAGTSGEQTMTLALDRLFNHATCAVHRQATDTAFVTSNPARRIPAEWRPHASTMARRARRNESDLARDLLEPKRVSEQAHRSAVGQGARAGVATVQLGALLQGNVVVGQLDDPQSR